jgi:NAD(P)-dependent dehydrogenase (short-subunit alcohol dehydrogenase family)
MKERVAVITGSGQGIGRVIALAYARSGFQVVVAEMNPLTGKKVESEIAGFGGQALFISTDVADCQSVERLMAEVNSSFGQLDVLVNNAGISVWHDPFDLQETEWDRVLDTNLKSVFFASREAAKIMKENNGGAIVNIASTRALMSEPNSEAYAASKGGILALTHAMAASFAPYRITVNAILPGWIETGDYHKLKDTDHQQHFSQRVGMPDDIARACLFLTSPDNNFVTGTQFV